MRRIGKTISAAAAVALLGAVAYVQPATAASGVGTALAGTTVLSIDVGGGEVLSLKVIGDEGQASNDPALGTPGAFSRLSVLKLNSTLVPAINALDDNLPSVESRTPGGSPLVETAAISLSTPAVGDLGAGSVASGSIVPARLSSSLDAGTAKSALTAQVTNLNLVGGLLAVSSAKSDLSALGAPDSAVSSRSVEVNSITVLDLGALLDGLGISLASLPVDTVVALVEGLGLPVTVSGLPSGSSLSDYVNGLRETVDRIESQGNLTGTVDSILGDLTTLLAPTGVSVPSTGTTLQAALDTVEALLDGVLATSLTELDGAPLVALDGVKVGVEAKAVDTLAGSTATVTGEIGKVRVGSVQLAGVNLIAATDAVNAAVKAVNDKVSTTLGLVDPRLASLVNVSVLERTTSVTASGGYNRARAGITGVTATVTPPVDLAAIVSTITSTTDPISGVVSTAGLSATMAQLESILNVGAAALSRPTTVRAAEVLAAADFAPAAATTTAPTPARELPRTGTGTGLPAALAGLALVGAFVMRRSLQRVAVRSRG